LQFVFTVSTAGRLVSLFLRKIIKIAATGRHILRPKCNKFDFGWGSTLTPLGELITALPQPPS